MSSRLPRTVITGIGIVSAAGIGIKKNWSCIRGDRPAAQSVHVPGAAGSTIEFPAFVAPEYAIGEVTQTVLPSAQLEREGINQARDLKHLVAAVGLALDDASLRSSTVNLDDVGIVIADEHPGVEALSRKLLGGVETDQSTALSDDIFELNPFLVPFRVARAFGLGGECLHINSACTSGLNAMDSAATQIRLKRTPVTVAAGSDDPLSSGKFKWFAERDLYELGGQLSAFSNDARGTVFGDGGAALVFEDRDHAIARGARIYAEYLGAGFAQDGWRVSAPHPQKANLARAIHRALSDAGVSAFDVDVVVPHGTGIRPTDQYEQRCINQVWGEDSGVPICLPLKPYVGHNLGGASILEAAILAKAIKAQELPKTAKISASARTPQQSLNNEWETSSINIAVKASAAFAGFYGAVVLGRSAP